MPYGPVNGLNMYYEVHGDGPPLLLLHGGSGSIPEKWIPFFTPQFRVIAPEQMGHGRTADLVDCPFHYHEMPEDTVELMRQLGIESAVVVGYSDGGIIALDMAIHHPERVTKLAVAGANARFDGYNHGESGVGTQLRSRKPAGLSGLRASLSRWCKTLAPRSRTSETDVGRRAELHERGAAAHRGAHAPHHRRPRHRHPGARRRDVQDDPWRATLGGSERRSRGAAEGDGVTFLLEQATSAK
jgi:pimeloyl-ACP methyl ester carboxylesterase